MKHCKLIVLLLSLVLTVTMLAACSKNGDGGTQDDTTKAAETDVSAETDASTEEEVLLEPIKIGHIVDLTGVEAMTGLEYQRAVQFTIESLGGKIGGHPVTIIEGDAQNTAATAAALAQKMVEEDEVIAILGPTQAGHKMAVAEYMKEVEVPLIFYNPTPPFLLQGNDWVIGANGGSPQIPTVMADYAYNELGYRKVNTISMDNAGGHVFIDPFVEVFTALGGEVGTQSWTPMPCEDMAPYLVNMEDADALVAWTSGSDAVALWIAWYDLGLKDKLPIITTMHGGFTDYFIAEAIAESRPDVADAMVGTYAGMMYAKDLDTPESKELLAKWVEKYGEEPRFVAAGSCSQAIYLLDAALKSIDGDTEPAKIVEAMFNTDYTGPEGHTFFENSSAATKDIYVMRVNKNADGKFDHELVEVYHDVPPTGLAK
ncbi:MAG: ABC transporter substrate-binding protein [Lachnospiraceae bacterium]